MTPSALNDDFYWMYATLAETGKGRAMAVTNDLTRDHRLVFNELRSFVRWRSTQVCISTTCSVRAHMCISIKTATAQLYSHIRPTLLLRQIVHYDFPMAAELEQSQLTANDVQLSLPGENMLALSFLAINLILYRHSNGRAYVFNWHTLSLTIYPRI